MNSHAKSKKEHFVFHLCSTLNKLLVGISLPLNCPSWTHKVLPHEVLTHIWWWYANEGKHDDAWCIHLPSTHFFSWSNMCVGTNSCLSTPQGHLDKYRTMEGYFWVSSSVFVLTQNSKKQDLPMREQRNFTTDQVYMYMMYIKFKNTDQWYSVLHGMTMSSAKTKSDTIICQAKTITCHTKVNLHLYVCPTTTLDHDTLLDTSFLCTFRFWEGKDGRKWGSWGHSIDQDIKRSMEEKEEQGHSF
jgi:hypothetical protein